MSQQTHALTYWTEDERGTDVEHRVLELAAERFGEELDKLFFGWLVDYRAYVMHGLLVFRCEVRAWGRTAVAEKSIPTSILLGAKQSPGHAAQAERHLRNLPSACLLKLAGRRTEDCQA